MIGAQPVQRQISRNVFARFRSVLASTCCFNPGGDNRILSNWLVTTRNISLQKKTDGLTS